MSNILLAYGNKAPGATLSGGQWESMLPLNNLKNRTLGKVARSDDATVYDTRFRFDLAANYTLRALALVNHNLTTAARWRVKVGTAPLDIDYTSADDPRDERVSFSGGANRTRVNGSGLIVSKTAPRIDYDPVTLANDGLVVEEGRTNELLYSDDLTNGAWLAVRSSASANQTTAPDGTTAADKLVEDSTASDTHVALQLTLPTITDPSVSVFAKAAGRNFLTICVQLSAGNWASATYSLLDGSITKSDTAGAATLSSATAAEFDDGWFLLKISVAGSLADFPVFCLSDTGTTAYNSDGQPVYNGDGTSGVYLWRASLEPGAFASAYPTPTTSAAVTATADVATITGSNFSGAHSATAGTLYAEFDVITTVAGTRPILSMDDNTANERFELYASGTDLKFKVVDGGSTVVDMTIGTIAATTFYKVAVAWAANDFAASLSGAAVVTDTSGTLPTVDRMRVGANQAGNYLNGHVRRFARWLTRRTNAELQALATTGPDALGYDTGWQNALQLTFHGDTPTNWGEQYPLIAAFDAKTVRYGTVEIDDTANPATYVQLGQLFIAGGFTTEVNPTSLGDGRTDLSSSVKSVGGQKYSTARRRPRIVDLGYSVLPEDEGEHFDEMMAEVGTTEDVLYVSDPADAAHTQRWGFLGTLRELSALEYPFFEHRATVVRIEQKL